MKTFDIPTLPNSTRLLVAGRAHRDVNGQAACGQHSGDLAAMTLAQALVWVRPTWCVQCFARREGGL